MAGGMHVRKRVVEFILLPKFRGSRWRRSARTQEDPGSAVASSTFRRVVGPAGGVFPGRDRAHPRRVDAPGLEMPNDDRRALARELPVGREPSLERTGD